MDLPSKHIFHYINHLYSTCDSDRRVYTDHFIGGRLDHIPDNSYGILINDKGKFLINTKNNSCKIIANLNSDISMNKLIPEIPFLLGFNPTFIIRGE